MNNFQESNLESKVFESLEKTKKDLSWSIVKPARPNWIFELIVEESQRMKIPTIIPSSDPFWYLGASQWFLFEQKGKKTNYDEMNTQYVFSW